MNIPKKIAISRLDIVQRDVEFPSGKKITLLQNKPYVTHDQEEIAFLSQLKGLAVLDLPDKEFRAYVTTHFSPAVDNPAVTEETAAEFKFTDEMEPVVVEWLKERGWTMYKKKKAQNDTAMDDDKDKGDG